MTQIYLIRHGQANSAATDEVSYDKLSDLGRQQARWLGQYLEQNEFECSNVTSGILHRQQDTADLLGLAPAEKIVRDPRLNEIEYYTLSQLIEEQFGHKGKGITGAEIAHHFMFLMSKWEADEIEGAPETYDAFQLRVASMLDDLRHQGPRTVAVTSGGVIAKAIQMALGLDRLGMVKCLLAGMNTGVTVLRYAHGGFMLEQMNALPHLDHRDRLDARTFY